MEQVDRLWSEVLGWAEIHSASDLLRMLNQLRAASTPEAAGRGDGWSPWKLAIEEARDAILYERYQMAEMDYGPERINAVLGVIDDCIANHIPAPPSGEQSSISENGRSSDFNNEEKLQSGQQGKASELARADAVNEGEKNDDRQ